MPAPAPVDVEAPAVRALRWLLWAAPAALIGVLVYAFGVDVPVVDQWDGVGPLFEKWEAGTLQFAHFYALHNEHRMLFPRLVMFGLAWVSGWNIRVELFVLWAMAVLCALNLWRLARATGFGPGTAGPWLLVAATALWFTPLQYENWLLGIQIGVMLPVACTTACAWIALSPRAPVRFVATAALAAVDTYSMASGFLCWPLTFPLLLCRGGRTAWREQRGWLAIWLFCCALTLGTYLVGYHRPPDHPDPWVFASEPLSFSAYALGYLGSNFSSGTALAPSAVAEGAASVLLALLAGCLAYLWRWRGDHALVARALPWLVPPGLAIGAALLTALGRLGFGVEQALMSRYIAFSIWLPIGLLFLVWLVFQHWADRAPPRRAAAVGSALIAVAAGFAQLHVLGALATAPIWADQMRQRLIAKALVELIDVTDEPEALSRYVHPNAASLRPRIEALDRLGFLRPALVRSRAISEIADPRDPGSAEYGELQSFGWGRSGQWGAKGWAVLPDSRRPADAVVLTQDDASGEPQIVTLAKIGVPRADVAGAKTEPAYVRAGWIERFDDGQLPEGARIKAWAFDAERGRAHRLAGEAVLQR
jgi:hypothetical protein